MPTFRLWGGWWPSCRRAIGGMACPSAEEAEAWGGLEEDEAEAGGRGGLADDAPPPDVAEAAVTEEEEDAKETAEEEEERALTASRPLRSAAGDTAPGGVRGEAEERGGGVWSPLELRPSGMEEEREEEEEGGGGGEESQL